MRLAPAPRALHLLITSQYSLLFCAGPTKEFPWHH